MKKMSPYDDDSLEQEFFDKLSDLFSAENQVAQVLPCLAEASHSEGLRRIFGREHLGMTRYQLARLQDIYRQLGQNPRRRLCRTTKGLLFEAEELISTIPQGVTRDTFLISIAQRMKRHEIDGYSTACEQATLLKHSNIMELLYKSLNDERAMNLDLSELAQGMINVQAIASPGHY